MAPRPHMRDKVQIGILTTVTTGYEPTEAFVYGAIVQCRVLRITSSEVSDGNVRKATGVEIHLKAGETVDETSRLKVTRRNGADLGTAEYYTINGEPLSDEWNRTIVCSCVNVPSGDE